LHHSFDLLTGAEAVAVEVRKRARVLNLVERADLDGVVGAAGGVDAEGRKDQIVAVETLDSQPLA
jgi:hypothetical protein